MLMERVKEGDTEALEQLIMRWRSRAEAYAAGILRDAHLAEDCVQEAFARLYAASLQIKSQPLFEIKICRQMNVKNGNSKQTTRRGGQ